MPIRSRIVDPHHHFFDTEKNLFQSFIKSLGLGAFLPAEYLKDVGSVPIVKTVHVEAMPDDGASEAAWIESLASAGACNVAGIVASVELAADGAESEILKVIAASPRVRGVRWILNYDGPFDGMKANPTWPRVAADFLRDAKCAAKFEAGFGLLSKYGLSFDLQCNPCQLMAAAALLARHPDIPVVIDHLGTPKSLMTDEVVDAKKVAEWREGMTAMAALPHVHVKCSMLGYVVPGWHVNAEKEAFLRSLVREVIQLFGARRCMFASNWHVNAAVSDFGGDTGPSMSQLYTSFQMWVADLPELEQEQLFAATAEQFYRI